MTGNKGMAGLGAIAAFRPFLSALAVFALTLALAPVSLAGEAVAVIAHKDNPVSSISASDLRKYYSDMLITWGDGAKVNIFDLPMDDPTRQVFSNQILGREPQDVTMDWANKRITNSAKNPPRILKSQKMMLSKVSKDPKALGYVAEGNVDPEKVKVVLLIK